MIIMSASIKQPKMINIVEQIYAHEGFGKEKIVAWLEKEMEDIFRDALGES